MRLMPSFPRLRVLKRDARAEDVALKALAGWANQFTSFVSLSSSQSLLLEVGGSARLFGGLQTLVCQIREETVRARLFCTARGGANTIGCIIACARGPTANRQASTRAASISCKRDRSSACMCRIRCCKRCREMGLRTFGDCYRLPTRRGWRGVLVRTCWVLWTVLLANTRTRALFIKSLRPLLVTKHCSEKSMRSKRCCLASIDYWSSFAAIWLPRARVFSR